MRNIRKLTTFRRFKIQTNETVLYFGIMKESQKEGWTKVVEDNGDSVELRLVDIDLIVSLEKKFFKQLRGTLSAGFSYSKSSDIGQISLSSNVQYATEAFEYQVSASALWSIDSAGLSRDREDAGLFVNWNFQPTWFMATGFHYQRNLELSIARRYQELIGGGNKLFVRKSWQLLGLSGLTFNQEKSTAGTTPGLLLEVPLILKFDFFKYARPDIQISSTQSVFFSLSQAGRIRYDNNTTFSWQIIRYFYVTLNPYSNYDSQPPEGSSKLDYGITFNISYKF